MQKNVILGSYPPFAATLLNVCHAELRTSGFAANLSEPASVSVERAGWY